MEEAGFVLEPLPPIIVSSDLSYEDALLGQFELVCCDAISVFLNSLILEQGKRDYLQKLFHSVMASQEFKCVFLTIAEIPATDSGSKFADQFLGLECVQLRECRWPISIDVQFKKARIMKHWADRIGVRLECSEVNILND